ncbi:hypothetical protein CUR178_02556 [Leishmania enriettii]|uniref:Uncharacterized protein n=1 Tax=Leishmania enriettii TaxID=5663 RepID=A0A836KFB1_LEIEN|nr:hypothetical protein CUR178_02556 [Leishmania enriettii]
MSSTHAQLTSSATVAHPRDGVQSCRRLRGRLHRRRRDTLPGLPAEIRQVKADAARANVQPWLLMQILTRKVGKPVVDAENMRSRTLGWVAALEPQHEHLLSLLEVERH